MLIHNEQNEQFQEFATFSSGKNLEFSFQHSQKYELCLYNKEMRAAYLANNQLSKFV